MDDTSSGLQWLRARARHHAATPMHEHTPDQQEAAAEYFDTMHKSWPPLSRIQPEERSPKQGVNNFPALEWHSGRIRRTRHTVSASSGAVPWYVPEGAEFDVIEPRSTKLLAVNGDCAWDRQDPYEYLDRYHLRADQLKQDEAEDWDLPTLRPTSWYFDIDLFDEVGLEERYRRMCEYKGWHYEPLLPRFEPAVDDDWRAAS